MPNYKFYIRKTNKSGTTTSSKVDMESYWPGLKYVKCTGLESVGEPKNIYTEDYAESDGLRVYHPGDVSKNVTHKETTVVLTLLFLGDDRRTRYNEFSQFVGSSRIYWWDTARHKKAWLVLMSETEPDEDTVNGTDYIKVDFTFKNIWGVTYNCNDNGTIQ